MPREILYSKVHEQDDEHYSVELVRETGYPEWIQLKQNMNDNDYIVFHKAKTALRIARALERAAHELWDIMDERDKK